MTTVAAPDAPSWEVGRALPELSSTPEITIAEAASINPWEKVRELAVRQLDRFVSLEPKALSGDDPGAIHDFRVASRRLQQVLDLLYPPPRPREIRRLRRKIRRCRRLLGEVRNCDVLVAYVEKVLKRKRTPRRESWVTVQHYLLERRAQIFEKAARKLAKTNLAVFYVHLKASLSATPGAGPLSSPPSVVSEVPAPGDFHHRITQALGRFWKAFETQVAQSHQDPRPPTLHAVRIASKRLRYLIEVVETFKVQGSSEVVAWLRAIQRQLGDWHDRQVLERMMIEMVARPEFLRDQLEVAMAVEKLILRNRATRKKFEEKYLAMTREELERARDWVSYLLASPPAAFAS